MGEPAQLEWSNAIPCRTEREIFNVLSMPYLVRVRGGVGLSPPVARLTML